MNLNVQLDFVSPLYLYNMNYQWHIYKTSNFETYIVNVMKNVFALKEMWDKQMPKDAEVLISIKVSERKIHSGNSVTSWRDFYVVVIFAHSWSDKPT